MRYLGTNLWTTYFTFIKVHLKILQNLDLMDHPNGIFGIRGYVWGCLTISKQKNHTQNFKWLNFCRILHLPPLSLAPAALSVWGQAPVWSWSSSSSWRGRAPRGRGRHRGPGGGCWSTMASCCSGITASSLQESRDSWWHSQVSCLTDCHRLPVLSSTISC